MTGVDKILVVIILVISSVFLYTAATVHGGKEDAREEFEELLKSEQDKSRILQDTKSFQALEIKEKDEIINKLREATKETVSSEDFEEKTRILESQVEEFKSQNELLQVQKDAALEKISVLARNVKTYTDRQDAIMADNIALKKTLGKKEDEKVTLNKNITEKIAEIEKYKTKIAEQKKMIKILESGGDSTDGSPTHVDIPDVTCAIQNVVRESDFTLVLLDKGAEEGLRVGLRLYVFNSTEMYKGQIEITEMHESDGHKCYAKIVDEVPGKKIAKGDTAVVKDW